MWRVQGTLQRIDLVSGRYRGESEVYALAGRLLLSTRQQAQDLLYRQLTQALFHVA
ncbi:hypothetical protein D3C79_1064150 [compost metagenome]